MGKPEIGDYEINIYKKGKNETALEGNWFDGCIFYTVKLEDKGYLDVATQPEAEIISRLVRIERKLGKR